MLVAPAGERPAAVHVAVGVLVLDGRASRERRVHLIRLAAHVRVAVGRKRLGVLAVGRARPFVYHAVRRYRNGRVRPRAVHLDIVVTHNAVVRVVPPAEHPTPVNVAVGVLVLDGRADRERRVDVVGLAVHVRVAVGRQRLGVLAVGRVRPFVRHAVFVDRNFNVRPSSGHYHVFVAHDSIVRRVPTAECPTPVNVAVGVLVLDGRAIDENAIDIVRFVVHVALRVNGKSLLILTLRSVFPSVRHAVIGNGDVLVCPRSANDDAPFDHRTVMGIGPTGEGPTTVDVTECVFVLDGYASCERRVDVVGLTLHVFVSIGGKRLGIVAHRLIHPLIHDAEGRHFNGGIRPSTRNHHVVVGHDAAIRVVPSRERPASIDVTIYILMLYHRARRVAGVKSVRLAVHQAAHARGLRCAFGSVISPIVGHIVRRNLNRLVRPRSPYRYVGSSHHALVRVSPTAEHPTAVHIAEIVVRFNHVVGRLVDRIRLTQHVPVRIDGDAVRIQHLSARSTPVVMHLVRLYLNSGVRPRTRDDHVAFAHNAVVRIGPTAKGVITVHITVLVFGVDTHASRIGSVDLILLIFDILIGVHRLQYVVGDILSAPIVGDTVHRDRHRLIRPRADNHDIFVAHRAVVRIGPTAERPNALYISIGIEFFNGISGRIAARNLVSFALDVRTLVQGKRRGVVALRSVFPLIRDRVRRNLLILIRPHTGHRHVGFAHDPVAGIGPPAEHPATVHVAVGVFVLNGHTVRKRRVDVVGLALDVCRLINRKRLLIFVRRNVPVPFVLHLMRCRYNFFERPRAAHLDRLFVHGPIARIRPSAERVHADDVAVRVMSLDARLVRVVGINTVRLAFHKTDDIRRQ